MKDGIHPNYDTCTVTCSCGNTFQTKSTKPQLSIDLCNECHPFFTGQQKFIDAGGRVQRFTNKFGSAKDTIVAREAAKKEAKSSVTQEAEAAKVAAREAKAAEKEARKAEFEKKAAAQAEKEAKEAASAPAEEAASAPAEEAAKDVVAEELAVDKSAPAEEAPAAEASAE